MEVGPKATNKHTLCGYAWSDVTNALVKSVGSGDMIRAQRWAAELVCSEQGLGKLEATLFNAWATHIGANNPAWCMSWVHSLSQIRSLWTKSGESTKAIRNTPIVRQHVAEAVSSLVLSEKRPFPKLPTADDCFRDAEGIRTRFRTGQGVVDQLCCRRIWAAGIESNDLRMIGNEFEAACRANNLNRALFWVIWFITLDTQTEKPTVKERGPSFLTPQQRKSVLWFLIDLLRDLANDLAFLSTDERAGIFNGISATWMKLGAKGRRDCLAAVTLMLCEHIARRSTPRLTTGPAIPSYDAVKAQNAHIDAVYTSISEEARKYMLEVPKINGLVDDPVLKAASRLSAVDKMALAYALISGSGGKK
jgi:hypothetical protein